MKFVKSFLLYSLFTITSTGFLYAQTSDKITAGISNSRLERYENFFKTSLETFIFLWAFIIFYLFIKWGLLCNSLICHVIDISHHHRHIEKRFGMINWFRRYLKAMRAVEYASINDIRNAPYVVVYCVKGLGFGV